MARTPAAQGSPSGRGADITAEEFGKRVHIGRVHTVRSLCASGLVPGASKIDRPDRRGQEWRIHWPTFYAALAGPGVPDGEIVTSRQLARHLDVPDRVVRRASAAPGTPGKLPGLQLGKAWLYAMPAVDALPGWSHGGKPWLPALPVAAGPVPGQPALPARFQSALEYPAQAAGQAPAARNPGRGAGAAARQRRRRPGPGRSPSPH